MHFETVYLWKQFISLYYFDTSVFFNTSLKSFKVSPTLRYMGIRSFQNVLTLREFDLSNANSLEIIFDYVLSGTGITTLDFRNCPKLSKLHTECFSNCPYLETVYFPCVEKELNISQHIFMNCSSLENMVLSECSQLIRFPASCFSFCDKLIIPNSFVIAPHCTCATNNIILTNLIIRSLILIFIK